MTDEPQPPLNREQRRAQKFRARSTARQDNLQSRRDNNTGFLATPRDSIADGPRESDARLTPPAEPTTTPAELTTTPAAPITTPAEPTSPPDVETEPESD